MRKKIKELISEWEAICLNSHCRQCEYYGDGGEGAKCVENMLADYLIKNGVIFPVRCEYCDWYREEDGGICVNSKCSKSYYGCRVPKQHFCSYGEPKESEE